MRHGIRARYAGICMYECLFACVFLYFECALLRPHVHVCVCACVSVLCADADDASVSFVLTCLGVSAWTQAGRVKQLGILLNHRNAG